MKTHRLARTALFPTFLTLLALLAGPAHAEEGTSLTTYDVELVIFRYLNPSGTPEQWNATPVTGGVPADTPEGDEAPLPTDVPTATPTEFPPMAASQFKLRAITDRLKRSRDYRVLAHIGWRQLGFSRENARPMSLDGLLPPDSQVTGQALLTRTKFLNLALNLRLTPAELPPDSPVQIVLSETRRMRSNEKHYIDHPYFGIVAIITPVGTGG